jgi:hypothetical protein
VRVLFVGDREQIPPVVVGGSREETVELSVLSSSHELIANWQESVLTKPYRQRCLTWAVASFGVWVMFNVGSLRSECG